MILSEKIIKRFERKHSVNLNGCWDWLGSKNIKMPYGRFRVGKKGILAHRFSYTINVGKIPEGLCVLHKCDNPSCVNPEHLFLGTYLDNVRDCIKKGRDNKKFRGRTHCINGHQLVGNNLILEKGRWKRCKKCRQTYLKKRKKETNGKRVNNK